MKKSKAKIVLIAAGILCVVFLLGSIIVQNLPEKSERKTKTKKETAFNEKSAYVMGNGYGSRGAYYKSENEFLYYLDAATGDKSIVCTKTNCEHEKGKEEGSMEQTDCEADFSHVSAYVPHGNKLYYIPYDPLGENAPWEIWQQDLTGGNQKKVAEIDDKVNTSILIMNMECDDSYMLVSFQEIGYYDESGKLEEYGNYCDKSGVYIINMNDWSFKRVYITKDQQGNALGKYADPIVSEMNLGSENASLYCVYYDKEFVGKKMGELPEKKQYDYLEKHVHYMQQDIRLSDGGPEEAVSFDGCHDFEISGDWRMVQDYYGNFKATQIKGGDGKDICIYKSPQDGKKNYDSGHRGVTATERSILYVRYNKKRDSLDWYRYDRETGQVECLAKPKASFIPQYATKDYVYATVFWTDRDYEECAIPLEELEKGTYQFPNKSEKKKMQEKQNKENNDPGDTVIWGVNGEQRPSEEAVKEINRYLKKSGHDFKVKFTSVLESDTDKIAEKYPEIDILQVPGSRVDNNCSADALKSGYYESLNDFLDYDGKKLKKQFSKTEWKQVQVNKEIYSVPNSMLDYHGIYIAYSKKLEGKQDLKEADTLEKVEKIVAGADVKVTYPIVLSDTLAAGNLSGFTDSDYCLGLALDHRTKKPELWYENKNVRSVYEKFHTWYQNGWLSKDDHIGSGAEDAAVWQQEILQKGDWLVTIGYGSCSEEIREKSCEIVRPKQTVFSKVNMSTGVAAASNCKEQAEKFLELAYTDQKIADLMLYGVQKGNDQVKDGKSDKTTDRRKYFQSYNVTESPLIGFQPDTEEYEKDLETYIDQMRKGEDIWQAEDFDREYGSLVKKLATKGMKQYRDGVEKQIEAWEK